MGEFGATLMVAGNLPGRTQTLSLAIYDAVQSGNDELANLYVLVTSVVCIAILVASSHMLRVRHG
jgi:molybdate transport system permease protein